MADETKTNATVVVDPKQPAIPDVDWEAKSKDLEAKLAKVSEDRDNYRKGLLAAKGKGGDESEDDKIARIVQEKLLETQYSQLLIEKDEIAQNAIKENKELKVALKNRAQAGASTSSGGGQDTTEVKTDFFTPEQLKDMENRSRLTGIKIDPEKVKANLLKIKQGL